MYDVEILKLEFYDYLMRKLTPTNVTIETYSQYEINEEVTTVHWGIDAQRRLRANTKIADNVMNAINITNSQIALRSKQQITFVKLNTIEQEYTSFYFIK